MATYTFAHVSNANFTTRLIVNDAGLGQVSWQADFIRSSTAWTSFNVNTTTNRPNFSFNIMGTTVSGFYTYDFRLASAGLVRFMGSGTVNVSPGVNGPISGTNDPRGSMGTASVNDSFTPQPWPAPVWTDLTITNSVVRGTGYYSEISATNYVNSYGVVGGSFPPGLSFNTSNGVISGTPTTDGYYAFTVRAYANGGTIDAGLAISVIPPVPVFSDGSVNSSARVGIAYSDGVSASDATSYAVNSGSLPTGLSLNSSNGAITGTPSAPGTFSFVIRASNSTGGVNTGTLTITVISAARVWNGTAFVSGLANVWNGSAFVTGTIRVWDGSVWKNTN
jgi:hypothetical protein